MRAALFPAPDRWNFNTIFQVKSALPPPPPFPPPPFPPASFFTVCVMTAEQRQFSRSHAGLMPTDTKKHLEPRGENLGGVEVWRQSATRRQFVEVGKRVCGKLMVTTELRPFGGQTLFQRESVTGGADPFTPLAAFALQIRIGPY